MSETKNPSSDCSQKGGEVQRMKAGTRLHEVRVYSQGLRVKGFASPNCRPPSHVREEGDIKGWSIASRRRMREWLLTHRAPDGWITFALTLTVPPLPEGSENPCITLAESRDMWKRMQVWFNDNGLLVVWRLEIQPRLTTDRADIRGIPQPHWHVIGAAMPDERTGAEPPESAGSTRLLAGIREAWFRTLGARSRVFGADKRAVLAELTTDWTESQMRYLFDHSSKAKASQVAQGWGRHWGIIGRRFAVDENPEVLNLTDRQRVELWRILRRLHSRRVPDRRSCWGIPWQCVCEVWNLPRGTGLIFRNGSKFIRHVCEGWHSWPDLPPVQDRKEIARAFGVFHDNVWALRISHNRRGAAGQWFGGEGCRKALAWVLGASEGQRGTVSPDIPRTI